MKKIIVIAGATGNLGARIVKSVLLHGGAVNTLVVDFFIISYELILPCKVH